MVGRGGFKKTRSQQQRLPPPSSLHTPRDSVHRAFVKTEREKLQQWPEGDHLQPAPTLSTYSTMLTKHNTGEKKVPDKLVSISLSVFINESV